MKFTKDKKDREQKGLKYNKYIYNINQNKG